MFHPEFMAMLGRGLQLKTLNVSYVQHPCSLINGKKNAKYKHLGF